MGDTMERQIILNGNIVNDLSDVFVIAELGHNHQGNVETAKKMIFEAKSAGANAVKLQKRSNKSLFVKSLYDSPYNGENSYGPTYGAHREALEFGKSEYLELLVAAKELGITLFATAFDFESADFLENINIPFYKTASGDLTNTPLLKHIAKFNKPVIISTGGGSLDDVKRAYDSVMPINNQICILQCTASYPVEDYRDMNLRVITTFRDVFKDVVIGLSDHESGISMALAAYMLGARVVEKHFTLNRAWRGTDHSFSLAPSGLHRLIRNLRRTRIAIGDGVKRRLASEEKPLFKMSKKIVANGNLSKGHLISIGDVSYKSPGDGLPPYMIDSLIGKKLLKDCNSDDVIMVDDVI